MKKITVIGGTGFIGSNLTEYLRKCGYECMVPARDDPLIGDMGNVIYCIGVTADFRKRPWDTIEAHVCKLLDLLRNNNFESLLYLSSTRVYRHMPVSRVARENGILPVDINDPDDIFNLSKLMGEKACLIHDNQKVRIARISNVYGKDYYSENFLPSIIRDALNEKNIRLHTSLDSEKDYISINDVVRSLKDIATQGKRRVYNVASGRNTSHNEITNIIRLETGASIEVYQGVPRLVFPRISIRKIKEEFSFTPYPFEEGLREMIKEFRDKLSQMVRYDVDSG